MKSKIRAMISITGPTSKSESKSSPDDEESLKPFQGGPPELVGDVVVPKPVSLHIDQVDSIPLSGYGIPSLMKCGQVLP